MKRIALATSAAAMLVLAPVLFAQDQQMTAAGPKDASITISGCVKAGTSPDSYLLFNVHNVSGTAAPESPSMVYWLDHATSKLKSRVGQSVEVTGTIERERSGKVEVKDEKNGSAKVEVKKGGDTVETTTAAPPAPAGTTGADVVKLKVHSIKTLGPTCAAQ